jgi:hypothetical protein
MRQAYTSLLLSTASDYDSKHGVSKDKRQVYADAASDYDSKHGVSKGKRQVYADEL